MFFTSVILTHLVPQPRLLRSFIGLAISFTICIVPLSLLHKFQHCSMMEELYGLQSTNGDYFMQVQNNMAASANYNGLHSPPTSFPFGKEQWLSGSTVSDSSSMVAQGHKNGSEEEVSSALREKISSHPLYPKLVEAYIDCQKVGAPPEMVHMLDEILKDGSFCNKGATVASLGADPELDQFMRSYCHILMKYRSDLSKPFDEATNFLNDIEEQLNILCNGDIRIHCPDEGAASSDEDVNNGGEIDMHESACRMYEDRDLKEKLFRRYSGYISSLKQEFSKKKKKGKLPKEATQILNNWWNCHYRWPYPTEADKVALANSTGLGPKQINNWFINQRKRHWKPTESMPVAVVDSVYAPFFVNH